MEDRLRKFAAVIETGSVTAAARQLRLSQPALTAAIHKLERELRVTLLDHRGRIVIPTSSGRIAYQYAKRLDAAGSSLRAELRLSANQLPEVSIGMIDSVASTFFANAASVVAINQLAHITVIVNNSRFLRQAVERAELAAAFITEPDGTLPALLTEMPAASESLLLVCAPVTQAAVESALRHGIIERFLSYDGGSTTFAHINRYLTDRHIAAEPAFYSSSPSVLLQLALQGYGSAILPAAMVQRAIDEGKLCVPSASPSITIRRRISLIRRQDTQPVNVYSIITDRITAALRLTAPAY